MEFVLVVPRRDLFADCYPQGFRPFGDGLSAAQLERAVREHGYFVERRRAERDPDLKQIIPYTLVTRRDRGGEWQVLLLRRLAKGGEQRLHDKLSIGVGGHIDADDARTLGEDELARVLDLGTQRELHEELVLDEQPTLRRVGLLNDDSNPVGAVHLGLVQVARVEGPVTIREQDVLEGRFEHLSALSALRASGADFETWSAHLVENLPDLVQESGSSRGQRREPTGAGATT
ncbi:MAG TPA: phosphoesterase [Planctomycetota bacterium]|nr:phosphoesterase [Planctomycetota bacterium]